MAKIVDTKIDSSQINKTHPVWQIGLLGLILGILYWLLTIFIMRYIGSVVVAGNVATILVATLGLVIMLNLYMARPLFVVLASAASLWGLSDLTNGLVWYEVGLWSAILYFLSYVLFSWLARYRQTIPVLIATILIVIIMRITITL